MKETKIIINHNHDLVQPRDKILFDSNSRPGSLHESASCKEMLDNVIRYNRSKYYPIWGCQTKRNCCSEMSSNHQLPFSYLKQAREVEIIASLLLAMTFGDQDSQGLLRLPTFCSSALEEKNGVILT